MYWIRKIQYWELLLLLAIFSTGCSQCGCATIDEENNYSGPEGAYDNQITAQKIEEFFKEARNTIENRERLERQLAREGKVIRLSDRVTDLSNGRRFSTDPEIRMREREQLPFEKVTKKILQRVSLTTEEKSKYLPKLPLVGPFGERAKKSCERILFHETCDPHFKYRTYDGTCNNLFHPTWGSTKNCMQRFLPAQYEGQSGFRRSVTGVPLPEPRDLSLNVHYHIDVPSSFDTGMFNFFGQFLDHDVTQAPSSTTVDNQAIQCCGKEGPRHPQCAPLRVRENDTYYSEFGVQCLNFVRSAVCPTCKLGMRQVFNDVTSYIDGSAVYGNGANETNSLRTHDGTGRLRVESTPFGNVLPPNLNPKNDKCSYTSTNDICFLTGDSRANQHPSLAAVHTIFVRHHNRLAKGLSIINPSWDDEKIFQEARRIIGAIIQVITYQEFLPSLLGSRSMAQFSLEFSESPTHYDPAIDPTIRAAFNTAAFRINHSLVNGLIIPGSDRHSSNSVLLRNQFFQNSGLRSGLMEPLLSASTRVLSQTFDPHLVPDMRNHLMKMRDSAYGLDLASINIQRGRDHGLPTYIQMLEFCSGGKIIINSFKDLVSSGIMKIENMRQLRSNYKNVRDIDMWTGILSENPPDPETIIGFTAPCILGLQFSYLKYGDRFYFEHGGQVGSFTYQQVQELKKVYLSSVACLNSEIAETWKKMMNGPDGQKNTMIQCKDIEDIDLSYWKE